MYYIGIDVGGTNLKAGLVDEDGRLLAVERTPLDFQGPEQFAAVAARLARAAAEQGGVPAEQIRSVGMGLPGAVSGGDILFTTNIPMQNIPIAELFRQHLDVPLYLGNDADCAAAGEFFCGAGRDCRDLAVITLGTLLYTIFKSRIAPRRVEGAGLCLCIGLVLGIMSSFLGIGGGPINLVVLFFFFGMDTKTAAQNSLYIILFSQAASLAVTLLTRSVPEFEWGALILMVCGGIGGGIVGRLVNKRISVAAVDKLFMGLMGVIILISVFNTVRYSVG